MSRRKKSSGAESAAPVERPALPLLSAMPMTVPEWDPRRQGHETEYEGKSGGWVRTERENGR